MLVTVNIWKTMVWYKLSQKQKDSWPFYYHFILFQILMKDFPNPSLPITSIVRSLDAANDQGMHCLPITRLGFLI